MTLRHLNHDQALTKFAASLDTPEGRLLLGLAMALCAMLFALHWLATRPKALRLRVQHRRLMRRAKASGMIL